jgi:hypothetical protein
MALRRDQLAQHVQPPQTIPQTAPKAPRTAPSVTVQLRWPGDDLEAVKRHFADLGLSLSAGIRLAVREHQRRHREMDGRPAPPGGATRTYK